MTILIILAVMALAYGAYRGKKLGWFDSKPAKPTATPVTLAARITGVVKPPDHEERIADRDRNRAEGNGDGGGVDGGIYMEGAFDLTTDATGKVVASNIIMHGTSGFTCVGHVYPDGSRCELNMKESGIHDVGLLVLTVNNGVVTGKMEHGGGKNWIDGNAVGTWKAA